MSEPAVQVGGGGGEGIRNQAIKAVEAVHQELPLCTAFSQHIALISNNNIQYLLQLILQKKAQNVI